MRLAEEARRRALPRLEGNMRAILSRVEECVLKNADQGMLSMSVPVEPYARDYVIDHLARQGLTVNWDSGAQEIHVIWLTFEEASALVLRQESILNTPARSSCATLS